MKTTWNTFDKRLAQTEVFNKRVIKKMIMGKMKSSHNYIFIHNLRGTIIVIFFALAMPILKISGIPMAKWLPIIIFECAVLIGIIYSFYLQYIISKFDMNLNSVKLMKWVVTYKKWYIYGMKYIPMLALITAAIVAYLANPGINQYILAIVLLVALSAIEYFQIKRHKNAIQEIEEGLEELKEFEQD